MKMWAERPDMGTRILWSEGTERQPKPAKARKRNLSEIYKILWELESQLGKWTRMMTVTEGLKNKGHKGHLQYARAGHLHHAGGHHRHTRRCHCH